MTTDGGDHTDTAPAAGRMRAAEAAAVVAVALLFLRQVAPRNIVDLDLFHQMALFRAALQTGWMPFVDVFAFTPVVRPSVHYEWGNGAIAYAVATAFGAAGLLVLKYVLSAAIAVLVVRTARLRGAGWPVICLLAFVAVGLGAQGFTTIRAGLFTMLFIALLLRVLEEDRRGRRAWVLAWLAVHVVWLNIHPGVVVGMALLGAHWLERLVRHRRPQWHLVALGVAMLGLFWVNPYGGMYPRAIWHAVAVMKLPPIPEWQPMWAFPDRYVVGAYAASVAVLALAVGRAGVRRCEGILLVLVCAAAALHRGRHASLYALVWLAYVPGWLQLSPTAELLDRLWARRSRWVTAACALFAAACVPYVVAAQPWRLRVPGTPEPSKDRGPQQLIYPVGATDYLKGQRFRGNLMTHYDDGSYVMWHLWPGVKIGMDSRNDVGYSHELISEIIALYEGWPGWGETLEKYPADLILIPRSRPLAGLMEGQDRWSRVYRDDAFDLWARPGLALPPADRTGQAISGTFP